MDDRLSPTQAAALEKLSHTQWKCPYDLKISMNTLGALVRKGYAHSRGQNKPGAYFSPTTTIQYIRTTKLAAEKP